MLSANVKQRLVEAAARQESYAPNATISEQLRHKSLVMTVSPTCVGKTKLMQQIVDNHQDTAMVVVFTTRDKREDDTPGSFDYVPYDDRHVSALLDAITARQLVQYAVHPSSYHLYGSMLSGYPARYNFLATLSGAVAQLRSLPFASTHTIGIVTDVAAWQQWFSSRFPDGHPERHTRLLEAITSLEWLLSHESSIDWLYNQPGKLEANAARLLDVVQGTATSDSDGAKRAQSMLDWARNQV